MSEIFSNDFSAGWTPDDDDNNGRPNGFLNFTNLNLNENGVVDLERGGVKINLGAFAGTGIFGIYSKFINAVRNRYIGTARGVLTSTSNFTVIRNVIPAFSGLEMYAFGNGFGEIFCSSGLVRMKDNGTASFSLGIQAPPAAPAFVINQPPFIDVTVPYSNWTLPEGTGLVNTGGIVQGTVSTTSQRTVMQSLTNWNTLILSSGSIGQDTDFFRFEFRVTDTSFLDKVRIEFLLEMPTGGAGDVANYYYFEWPINAGTAFRVGINQWSTLQCLRSDFIRAGDNVTLDWTTVKGINVKTLCTDSTQVVVITNLNFKGGSLGAITGNGIQYYQQNVRNNGTYLAKSPLSPVTAVINIVTGSVTLTPNVTFNASAGVTDIYFYRSGNTLDNVYFVGSVSGSGVTFPTFTDNKTDVQVLEINIKANLFLNSIFNLTEVFIAIEGPIAGRMVYLTTTTIYISDLLNPDAYDTRFILKLNSIVGEQNLWLQKTGGTVLIVGTTADIYVISGTFAQLADGTIDVVVTSLGVKQPPISRAVAVYSGAAYYLAADGIRYINSGTSFLVSSDNRLLFDGYTRYGVAAVDLTISAVNNDIYGSLLCINKNKLYFRHAIAGGTYQMFVYDLVKQYWKFYNLYGSITALFSEEDGNLLTGSYDDFLRSINTGNVIDTAGNYVSFNLRTTLRDGKTPRQRKNVFTLKINCDTGGDTVEVHMYTETDVDIFLGYINNNGLSVAQFNVAGNTIDLKKRYSLHLYGQVRTFKLVDWSLDYLDRPIPLNSLRIEPTNYGVAGRKRINNIPLVIDTLGHDVNIVPIVDGVLGPLKVINTNEKLLYSYQYDAETYGTMIGLNLQSVATANSFEFYELVQAKEWDLLPDRVNYLYIPQSNLGTHQRKRVTALALVINTFGANVVFTPNIDSTSLTNQTINTSRKTTVLIPFSSDTVGIDIWGVLDGTANLFEFYGIDIQTSVYEVLPHRTTELRTTPTNFGSQSFKRLPYISFNMDTVGSNVTVTPYCDGTALTTQIYNTSGKTTVYYYLTSDKVFTDFFMILTGTFPFEFYGYNEAKLMEVFPDKTEFIFIPSNNLGSYQRKRIRAIAFVCNCNGFNITFTPVIDGSVQAGQNFSSNFKQTLIYYFTSDVLGVDISGTIVSTSSQPFEFYGLALEECIFEVLPGRAEFMALANNNLGSYSRKRIITIAFVINTFGNNVTFTPSIDNSFKAPQIYNTSTKTTVIYYFTFDNIGVDIGATISGAQPFEFYGLDLQGCIFETLPPRSEYTVIANTNLGSYSRKRIISIPFVINTFGVNVTFIPTVDGRILPSAIFNTVQKQTVVYFLPDETIGVDFGGTFSSLSPFEYYNFILEEIVIEKMPPRTEYYVIPANNFGSPSKKRVRTIPLVINTFGSEVNFYPIVDGVISIVPTTFNTPSKKTVFHYFLNDSFGVDYGGKLRGISPFEFYGFANDITQGGESVEILPVAKIFDQIGPHEFNQSGKVLSFRLRMIATGLLVRYSLFADDVLITDSTFPDFSIDTSAFQNQDHMYSVKLPKSILCQVFRMELLSDAPFNKFSCEVKVNIGGVDSRDKYIQL